MNILVEYANLGPSVYVHDIGWDWSETNGIAESIHLALRCRHENIGYDLDNDCMYCPDCNNEHLTPEEELQYFLAYKDEGDLSDDDGR